VRLSKKNGCCIFYHRFFMCVLPFWNNRAQWASINWNRDISFICMGKRKCRWNNNKKEKKRAWVRENVDETTTKKRRREGEREREQETKRQSFTLAKMKGKRTKTKELRMKKKPKRVWQIMKKKEQKDTVCVYIYIYICSDHDFQRYLIEE